MKIDFSNLIRYYLEQSFRSEAKDGRDAAGCLQSEIHHPGFRWAGISRLPRWTRTCCCC